MSGPPPIIAEWTGEALEPLPRFRKECDKTLTIGERYRIDVIEERSAASHRQYFAALHEYWLNLPELVAPNYPSADHLRKHALIMTGFRNERLFVCESHSEAEKVAAFVESLGDAPDATIYTVVVVRDVLVMVLTAKSQSTRGPNRMDKEEFQKSKQAVLDYCAELVGAQVADPS